MSVVVPPASVSPAVVVPSAPVICSPWLGCPAPLSRAVVALARSFLGLGVCSVRPSSRSFSGWVCVCSFASGSVARSFAAAASSQFQLPFCAVRAVGARFRVSVPCVPSVPVRLGRSRGLFRGRRPVLRLGRGVVVPFRVSSLPVPVASALGSTAVVGFSGSRSVVPSLSLVAAVVAAVPAAVSVSVGCARGVDALFRAAFPAALVFAVSSFGRGRGAFAARSVACVRSVAVSGGVWVSFPGSACPAGLVPSSLSARCFSGSGSGSWASLAFALGLGVRCLVWLPVGVSAPLGWGLLSVGGGWWVACWCAVQLSLF